VHRPSLNHFIHLHPGAQEIMNRIIWLVGAVVIILLVLGFFGLR
jgi:hypothetical protein